MIFVVILIVMFSVLAAAIGIFFNFAVEDVAEAKILNDAELPFNATVIKVTKEWWGEQCVVDTPWGRDKAPDDRSCLYVEGETMTLIKHHYADGTAGLRVWEPAE
jgi:hypothetical protein